MYQTSYIRIVVQCTHCQALTESLAAALLQAHKKAPFYLFRADLKALLSIEFSELHARIARKVCVCA